MCAKTQIPADEDYEADEHDTGEELVMCTCCDQLFPEDELDYQTHMCDDCQVESAEEARHERDETFMSR